MENLQVSHIKDNIDRLTNLTTCNVSVIAALQAKDLLSKAETQKIDTKTKNEGDLAAAHAFYEIMMMKKNSYDILIKVLKDACLTGAASILEELYSSTPNTKGTETTNTQAMAAAANATAQKLQNDLVGKKIIGTEEDCDVQIDEIMDIVTNSDTVQTMLQSGKWKTIAMKLGISYSDRDRWNKEFTLGQSSLLDLLERTLIQWSSKNGKEATLGIFMETVKNCEMKSFSEKMKETFK